MKRFYAVLVAALLLAGTLPPAKAATEVSVDFFYNKLEPYGDWLQVASYGYCWHPRDVSEDWRPYTDGRWAYTDAGWTWDSDEPFGWATYHYGRWAKLEQVGWVWVPGHEWGPAWVSWRRSPNYVGWAPLPPEAKFTSGSRITPRVDVDYDIGPEYYSFVEVRNFGAPRLNRVVVEPQRNVTIIQETRNITRVTYQNNMVVNEGPRYDVITREVSQPIPRLRLEREAQFDPRTANQEQLKARVEGNTMRVPAFAVNTRSEAAPAKVTARVEKAQIDHGWKHAGSPAEVQKLRAKLKSEPAPIAEGPETRPGAQSPEGTMGGTTGNESTAPGTRGATGQRPGATTRERGATQGTTGEPSAAERQPSIGAEVSPSPSASPSGSLNRERSGATTREHTGERTAPSSEASPSASPSSRAEPSATPSPSSETTTRPETRRQSESARPSESPRATTRGSAGAAAGETTAPKSSETTETPGKHLEKHGKTKHGHGTEPESAAPSPAAPPQAGTERTSPSSRSATRSSREGRKARGAEGTTSSAESRASESGAAATHEKGASSSSRTSRGEESMRGSHEGSSRGSSAERPSSDKSERQMQHSERGPSSSQESSSHKASAKEKGEKSSSSKEKGESEPHL